MSFLFKILLIFGVLFGITCSHYQSYDFGKRDAQKQISKRFFIEPQMIFDWQSHKEFVYVQ